MSPRARDFFLGIAAAAILFVGWWYAPRANAPTAEETPVVQVSYACDGGKTIAASFHQGVSKLSSPGEPPVPGGSVGLSLSDGRVMALPQTISADGARYANADESFVFWSKGNGALVLEGNQEKSYVGCIETAPDPGGLPQIYEDGAEGFSIRYPAGYTADANYRYQELGPGEDIGGVKFTVSSTTADGTNLGPDSYVSVEEIPQVRQCVATMFLDGPQAVAATTTDDGVDYSVATSNGAGAGNRYDETVYAIPGTNPCTAVRYFVHYSVLENYPPGAVKAFDYAALSDQFDAIRRTLVLNP